MNKQHTIEQVLAQAGMTLADGATISAVVIVTGGEGCSIMPVALQPDAVVHAMSVPKNIEANTLSRVLAVEGCHLLTALVQEAGLGEPSHAVTMTEQEDGSLKNDAMDTIMAQIKGSGSVH